MERARLTRAPAVKASARVKMHLEMLIGLIGFFTLALFVMVVVAELSGQAPIALALVLLVSAALLWAVIRYRQKF